MTIHKNKYCTKCETIKEGKDYYRRRKGADLSPYCKACTNKQTILRQQAFKRKCVEYKGGKCEICGYSKYFGALEFHHKDPTQKDFSIAKARMTSFNERIEKELDKCMCLCSNCHREEHARQKGLL